MLLDAFFFIKFPMILLVNLVLGQKLELLEQAAPVDKMNRILCSDWLDKRASYCPLGIACFDTACTN